MLEDKVIGVRTWGRPRRNWIDDVKERTNVIDYSELKRKLKSRENVGRTCHVYMLCKKKTEDATRRSRIVRLQILAQTELLWLLSRLCCHLKIASLTRYHSDIVKCLCSVFVHFVNNTDNNDNNYKKKKKKNKNKNKNKKNKSTR